MPSTPSGSRARPSQSDGVCHRESRDRASRVAARRPARSGPSEHPVNGDLDRPTVGSFARLTVTGGVTGHRGGHLFRFVGHRRRSLERQPAAPVDLAHHRPGARPLFEVPHLWLAAKVITRTSPVAGSKLKPTGVTCGEPSGRNVVNVARWRSARKPSTAPGRFVGSRATGGTLPGPRHGSLRPATARPLRSLDGDRPEDVEAGGPTAGQDRRDTPNTAMASAELGRAAATGCRAGRSAARCDRSASGPNR